MTTCYAPGYPLLVGGLPWLVRLVHDDASALGVALWTNDEAPTQVGGRGHG